MSGSVNGIPLGTSVVLAELSDDNALAPGTAAPGTDNKAARDDHVHAPPSFAQINAALAAASAPVVLNGKNLSGVNDLAVGGDATITGKTIAPTVGPTSGRQHALPSVTSDTVALLAAVQALTNKTLTSPVLTTPSFGNGTSIETATANTTNGTVTTVWSKVLADSTVYELDITLVGRRTDVAGRAVYRRRVVVYQEAASVTVGTPDVIGTDLESTAGYDVTIDNSTTTLRVRATGNTGHAITWTATVRIASAAS